MGSTDIYLKKKLLQNWMVEKKSILNCEYCGKKIGLLAVRYTWLDKENHRAIHDKCLAEYKKHPEKKVHTDEQLKLEEKNRSNEKKIVVIGIVALVIVFITIIVYSYFEQAKEQVSNVLNSDKDRFVGTWQNTTQDVSTIIDFFSNGTCKYDIVSGTWDVKDAKLVIAFSNDYSRTYDYKFSDNDRTVSLTQTTVGVAQVFTKQ